MITVLIGGRQCHITHNPMGKREKSIDAYIMKSAAFAQPILEHLRDVVHKACPDVMEKIKWSAPHFEYKGMLCNMAAFKAHCAFGFWKAALMEDKMLMQNARSERAMGHLGKITSLKDLPPNKVLISYIREAMKLNEAGVRVDKPKPVAVTVLAVPAYFTKALSKNKIAQQHFKTFSPSAKKEYVMWLEEAKTDETRNKRLATAVEWIEEGKQRHWKYQKK